MALILLVVYRAGKKGSLSGMVESRSKLVNVVLLHAAGCGSSSGGCLGMLGGGEEWEQVDIRKMANQFSDTLIELF